MLQEKKILTKWILSPLDGDLLPLEDVKDEAFSQKMMGDGIALLPTGKKVLSPVSGYIDTVSETKHAVGIHTDWGADILIHVGQDTVSLNGKGFKTFVKEGDWVEAGDLLIKFNPKVIQKAGLNMATPITIVNTDDFYSVIPLASEKSTSAGQNLIKVEIRA